MEQPNLSKPVFKILPGAAEEIKNNKCPFCNQTIDQTEFRDELSRKEYSISGLCQRCQDEVFGE